MLSCRHAGGCILIESDKIQGSLIIFSVLLNTPKRFLIKSNYTKKIKAKIFLLVKKSPNC